MNDKPDNLNEAFLDNAATEAIGAHGIEESDAFTIELAKTDETHRQATRDLRDTVARMAGAAPYLDPPSHLRGAILQATAPKTFKIDDYRRTNDVSPRWLRRSLVASIGFLIFAAWYNALAKTEIDKKDGQITSMAKIIEDAKTQVKQLADADQEKLRVLGNMQTALANATLANPSAPRGLIKDAFGNQFVLLQDPASSQLMVLIPNQVIPPGKAVTLSDMGPDGKPREWKALAIGKPFDSSAGWGTDLMASSRPVNVQWQGISDGTPFVPSPVQSAQQMSIFGPLP